VIGRQYEIKASELKPDQEREMGEKASKFMAELRQMWQANQQPSGKFKVLVIFEEGE
jgi:hypothetical protein